MLDIIRSSDAEALRRLLQARTATLEEAEAVVRPILDDIRRHGDRALRRYAKRFDHVDLGKTGLTVARREIHRGYREVLAGFVAAVHTAAANIRKAARRQLPRPWTCAIHAGVSVGQIIRPLERVACYVPGGRFPLPSTVLMSVIPAQEAGVPGTGAGTCATSIGDGEVGEATVPISGDPLADCVWATATHCVATITNSAKATRNPTLNILVSPRHSPPPCPRESSASAYTPTAAKRTRWRKDRCFPTLDDFRVTPCRQDLSRRLGSQRICQLSLILAISYMNLYFVYPNGKEIHKCNISLFTDII